VSDDPANTFPASGQPSRRLGDAETVFERSRLAAVFVAALLVPALLVIDGPRDWRLALVAATPILPPISALLTLRRFGVDAATATQFGIGTLLATIAAASGFGMAVPALIVTLMVMDGLLISRQIWRTTLTACLIVAAGMLCILVGGLLGGLDPVAEIRTVLLWLILPTIVQLGSAIVAWRSTTSFRRESEGEADGVLHNSVDRAQREVGLLLDHLGRVEDVTGNVRDVMGLRASDVSGRSLVDRLHVLDRPAFLRAVADAASDSRSNVLRLRFARLDEAATDGGFRWFEGRVFPVSARTGAALLMVRDINEEMTALAADADRRRKAEDERRRRAGFLADLSHDVRTPLNAIIGFSELLSNPITQPKEAARITEYADIVHRSGRDLLEVVTMLVEMTRVENGAFEFLEEAHKPQTLIEQLRETLSEAIERPDFVIRASGDVQQAGWMVDRRAARQVLFGIGSTLVDLQSTADLAVHVSTIGSEIRFRFEAAASEGRPAGRRTVTAGLSLEVARSLACIMGGHIVMQGEALAPVAELVLPLGGREDQRATSDNLVELAAVRAARATASWSNALNLAGWSDASPTGEPPSVGDESSSEQTRRKHG
jgi:two-component system, cell cycle sensor histidine kinase DivJ